MGWKWTRAVDVQESWEGEQAWRWEDGSKFKPHLDYIPEGFSREPHHCRGVWFKRMSIPKPPAPTAGQE
ncbi:MAG: hypothetical protein JWP25_8983 [Bradyrhizobium sp.]|nr:hypothetical protein [Bradyrhizobium sp.]